LQKSPEYNNSLEKEFHFRQEQNRLVLVTLKLFTSKNWYDAMKTTNTTYSKILIAVDGSNASMHAADYGISLAEKYKAQLSIMNVLDVYTLKQTSSSVIVAPTYGLKEVVEVMRQVQKWVDKIKKKAEEKNIQSKAELLELKKSVVATIVNYAESEKIDLIVVGTKGRSGLRKLLLGSVAEGVVTYAHCPVLVVK
jgi:nucleotide-binding universal stress UspA family protein